MNWYSLRSDLNFHTLLSLGAATVIQTTRILELAVLHRKDIVEYLWHNGAIVHWPREEYRVRYSQLCAKATFAPV